MSDYQPLTPEEAAFWRQVREEFLVPADEAYLNSGTLSAVPRCVVETVCAELRAVEANPTLRWRDNRQRAVAVRDRIAAYLGSQPDDLVFFSNVTISINALLRGLPLDGGEAIYSDHEYGACINALRFIADRRGMTLRSFPLPPAPSEPEEVVASVCQALSPATRLVMISHVTSGRGIVVPVERLAEELDARGVRLVVDGAHAPGLVSLNLDRTRLDTYGGNLHKWFMGPKGSAFAWVARRHQQAMSPLMAGFGGDWKHLPGGSSEYRPGTAFQFLFGVPGCFDLAPWLGLAATLDFRARIGEERILRRVRQLTAYLRESMARELGWPLLSPTHPQLSAALTAYALPRAPEGPDPMRRFFEKYRITVALHGGEQPGMRVSTHISNSEAELDRLVDCLRREFAS